MDRRGRFESLRIAGKYVICMGYKYAMDIIIVVCVYAALFGLCWLDVKDYAVQAKDIEELLCVISGFPLAELPMIQEMIMMKWMLGLSVIFTLTGRRVYDQQNNLKYIAMVRYGSYRRFYRSLMNKTAVNALLYGSAGILITYVLYTFGGNGQVSDVEFLEICLIYLSQIVLLCLIQTLCMILTKGYTASVALLILWFAMAMCGHLILQSNWIWLPVNWGMYIRGEKMISGGVPNTAYYIQIGVCFLLWAGVPLVIKRKN